MENLVHSYRLIQTFVKVLPFVYAVGYLVAMVGYLFCNEVLSTWLDYCLYVSPLTVLMNLCLHRLLELCKWHRLACLLPLIAFATVVVDSWVVEFGHYAVFINVGVIIILLLLSLLSAYFVFIKRKD